MAPNVEDLRRFGIHFDELAAEIHQLVEVQMEDRGLEAIQIDLWIKSGVAGDGTGVLDAGVLLDEGGSQASK